MTAAIPASARPGWQRILVVTAVEAEAAAAARNLVPAGDPDEPAGVVPDHPGGVANGGPVPRGYRAGAGEVDVVAAGVGTAAAAATTATLLTAAFHCGRPYHLVLSVGVAGGFAPLGPGDTVVADAVVQPDLGAEDGDHFLPLSHLGLGAERIDLDPPLVAELARRTGGWVGPVLSVTTVTGSTATAARRRDACPGARAEAMEGAGVLAAGRLGGVAFGEVRTISNVVGPRDRGAWRMAAALDALAPAVAACVDAPVPVAQPMTQPVTLLAHVPVTVTR